MYRILIGIVGIGALLLVPSGYERAIEDWHKERDRKLRSDDSWLTLVGLFWLKPGEHSIGSGDRNEFILPKGSAPEHVGELGFDGSTVTFRPPDGQVRKLSYNEEKPDVIHAGTISFYIIKRGSRFAVRAKDSASPVRKGFAGMKYFPTNPNLRFAARLIPDARKIAVPNILGETELDDSPGVVEFHYEGKAYHLRPIYEDKTLFFIFKDPTSKNLTYQAGRMLNTPLPENGRVDLDFNRSYNPPCTFTPYATCPLPPRENVLPFPVAAGELRYGKGHVEYESR